MSAWNPNWDCVEYSYGPTGYGSAARNVSHDFGDDNRRCGRCDKTVDELEAERVSRDWYLIASGVRMHKTKKVVLL